MLSKASAITAVTALLVACGFSPPTMAADQMNRHRDALTSEAATKVVTAIPDFKSAAVTIPKSFLGISVEYGGSLRVLFGKPRLSATVRLLNRLGHLQGPPVLRIGGNSEDSALWNLPVFNSRPAGDTIDINSGTAGLLRAAAMRTDGKLILGINFGRGTPGRAKPWIRAALRDIGAEHILAFEIGNEPDLYNHNGMRPHSYNVQNYLRQWNGFARMIQPLLPKPELLAGPAFCADWRKYTPTFIRQQHRRLAVVTMHEYPLGAPIKNKRSPRYASIANLLRESSSAIFARLIRGSVRIGRHYHIPVRFAEINSAYGGGKAGVSNVFAACLWSLDTMFEVASTGAAGVNFHTGPRYGAFWSFHHDAIRVLPLYYGMLMFAQAAPPGSRLVPVHFNTRANIKFWMTLDRQHVAHIVLINKDLHKNVLVKLKLSGSNTGQLERLTAASISSHNRIYIGGRTFNGSHNGKFRGTARITELRSRHDIFAIPLSHASAALLTVQLTR